MATKPLNTNDLHSILYTCLDAKNIGDEKSMQKFRETFTPQKVLELINSNYYYIQSAWVDKHGTD